MGFIDKVRPCWVRVALTPAQQAVNSLRWVLFVVVFTAAWSVPWGGDAQRVVVNAGVLVFHPRYQRWRRVSPGAPEATDTKPT